MGAKDTLAQVGFMRASLGSEILSKYDKVLTHHTGLGILGQVTHGIKKDANFPYHSS